MIKNKKSDKKQVRAPDHNLPIGASYATFDRRLIAATIDIFILILLSIPLTRMLELAFFGKQTTSEVIANILQNQQDTLSTQEFIAILRERGIFFKIIILQISSIILLWLYCVISWCYAGATIGKYIMKLKLLTTDQHKIGFWRSNARFFAYIPSTLFIFLGFFWIYFNDKKRAWHDYLASTIVIYQRSSKKLGS